MKSTFAVVVLCLMCSYASTKNPEFPELNHINPSASNSIQAQTVQKLINRKIPQWSHQILVAIDPSIGPMFKDTFRLTTTNSKLQIYGTSGVAATLGLYYYLSQYCGCHISWAGDQLNLPAVMPQIPFNEGITITTNDRFRYYQNVCTVSYSFVWWNWTRWEQEIDWMALSGINMPLAFNGQEAIWQRVYNKMGFSDEVLGKHFGGPAFLAWARMGNMHGWGGPLTPNWHNYQLTLQHKILTRMRGFGMIPVLPAFAGHVPENFKTIFPSANVSRLSDWGHFDNDYCCTTLLDVTDPMFLKIGKAFVEEYTHEFGTDHLYNTDTFNEMTPKSGSSSYLSAAGKAVFQGLTSGDPMAIWVMQGWLFQSSFWSAERAKALLTSVPIGRMIVLDLYSEVSPKYTSFSSYFGQPFIWCMLHNFGGTVAMYGALESINEGPHKGRMYPNSTMIGTGLTPEGINQNDVVYEFMNEQAWRPGPRNITTWIENYAKRRYGMANADAASAWKLLQGSVYNCTGATKDHSKQVIINSKPRLKHPLKPFSSVYNCTSGYEDFSQSVIIKSRPRLNPEIKPAVWYDPEDVYKAWDKMVAASPMLGRSSLFRYDYVDVGRQSLQLIAIKYYNDVVTSFKANNSQEFEKNAALLLGLFTDLDMLLGTDAHFLLGRWISDAKALAHNEDERKLYEFNARNQVTLWGPTGQILDYANKQWAGLTKGYYFKRWYLFISYLEKDLKMGVDFNEGKFSQDVLKLVELPFQTEKTEYSNVSIGDTLEVSKMLHSKYRPMTIRHHKYFNSLKQTKVLHTFNKDEELEPWSYKYGSKDGSTYQKNLKVRNDVAAHEIRNVFREIHRNSFSVKQQL